MKATVFNTTIYEQFRVGKIIHCKSTISAINVSSCSLHILHIASVYYDYQLSKADESLVTKFQRKNRVVVTSNWLRIHWQLVGL